MKKGKSSMGTLLNRAEYIRSLGGYKNLNEIAADLDISYGQAYIACKMFSLPFKGQKVKKEENIVEPIADLPGEEWKDVPGFEGYYIASNKSRVKALPRVFEYGSIRRRNFERIIKPVTGNYGYNRVCLNTPKGIKYTFFHRIIALAFIPNPLNLPFINHKNGVRNDNRIENLEWCTNAQNMIHSLKYLGHKGRKLTDDQVREVRVLSKSINDCHLGKLFKVSRDIIRNIRVGVSYTYVD